MGTVGHPRNGNPHTIHPTPQTRTLMGGREDCSVTHRGCAAVPLQRCADRLDAVRREAAIGWVVRLQQRAPLLL